MNELLYTKMPTSFALEFFIFLTLLIFFVSTDAQTLPCNNETFSFAINGKNIKQCKKLGALGAELGWNYHHNTKINGSSSSSSDAVDILFGARLTGPHGWVAWGVNPLAPQMVGTRAFIASKHHNGSLVFDDYNVTADTKRGCQFQPLPNGLSYVSRGVEYATMNDFLTMYLTVYLPSGVYNVSSLNHVWQVGSHLEDMEPKMHATSVQNFDSCQVINLTNGVDGGGHHQLQRLREVHGVLNIIGWGTLLPLGIICARYFKEFPIQIDRWFRWHLSFQLLGFVIGTIGWAIGISLGSASKNYTFSSHRIIGITIYSVAALQILALWLRPKPNDDYRKYWHIYHHFLGYSLFSLIVVNIFKGIGILRPGSGWKWAYVAILCVLGFIVLVLEICTWVKFTRETYSNRKKKDHSAGQPSRRDERNI